MFFLVRILRLFRLFFIIFALFQPHCNNRGKVSMALVMTDDCVFEETSRLPAATKLCWFNSLKPVA